MISTTDLFRLFAAFEGGVAICFVLLLRSAYLRRRVFTATRDIQASMAQARMGMTLFAGAALLAVVGGSVSLIDLWGTPASWRLPLVISINTTTSVAGWFMHKAQRALRSVPRM